MFKETNPAPDVGDELLASTHDLPRTVYFQANPHWTAGAQQAMRHLMSFARHYAEHGDHEVSGAALSALVNINQSYVEAKGKTFFGNPLLFDNPLSTDRFVNDTRAFCKSPETLSWRLCLGHYPLFVSLSCCWTPNRPLIGRIVGAPLPPREAGGL